MSEQNNEIVYVLTNPAMPGLVKIGKTNQKDIEERMKQLYTTGVPLELLSNLVYDGQAATASG